MKRSRTGQSVIGTTLIYIVCIFLTILSIFPFWTMLVNATRSTNEIQQHAVSLIPSSYLMNNWKIIIDKGSFQPLRGFMNSMIVSTFSTLCAVYFSTLTAYAIVIYDWKARRAFFTFIMAVMMIPQQVVTIGFYQMIYKVHLTNNFLPLILPSIAAPTMVFFMKQYMEPALSKEIIQSARIDGAKEFFIFNRIALPIMKPAMATQAIFGFVASWNNLYTPSIILATKANKGTMPMFVEALKSNDKQRDFGQIYCGLFISVLPIMVAYFILSKYIVAGVALGGVKE